MERYLAQRLVAQMVEMSAVKMADLRAQLMEFLSVELKVVSSDNLTVEARFSTW